MGEVRRLGSLEIDEDIEAQEREWKASVVAWIVFALFLLAGLLGLVGPGPLSDATAGATGDPLQVEYARFAHYQTPERLRVRAAAGGDEPELRVSIDREYLDAIEIERITPEPASVVAESDRLVYVFRRGNPSAPSEVEFRFEFRGVGPRTCRIGTEDGQSVSFRQFVYP